MLLPSKPENESQRLLALARYDVLDSAAEASFDEITNFIAKICGTPIALISLLDQNRKWFKSSYGWDATETPRDSSFCAHAVLQPDAVMIVPDTTQDERFVDNPLVTGMPYIHFYAGTPLVTDDGFVLGTLSVMDRSARVITADQVETLRLAGRTIVGLLEKRYTTKLLETQIADRRRVEQHLSFVSAHDSLTSLPNRAQFLTSVQVTFDRLNANVGHPFAVCFFDLDHFKQINDRLGHCSGDELLTEIGRRLMHITRAGDIVARLGGDEFTMLIENVSAPGPLRLIVARIANAIRAPLMLAGAPTSISASIGVVHVDKAYASVEDIIRDADLAMYASKDRGRDRFTLFTTDLRDQFTLENEMKLTLRGALDNHEFRLGYQPIVPLTQAHARPIAFEALLRWQQHDGSHITAAQFIDTAERTGMIVELGYWVLREACAQAGLWRKTGGEPIVTTVNVSAKQLAEPGFVLKVKRTVREAKIDPRLLGIEVTESILIGDVDASLAIMRDLRAFGIRIYLDDFGTGYSSLSYLRKFPVDRIKIDRSFVSGVDDELADPIIVASVIALAHKLNIRVVAEGVETEQQRLALKELGCDFAQGYLFSRAVPSHEAAGLLLAAEHVA